MIAMFNSSAYLEKRQYRRCAIKEPVQVKSVFSIMEPEGGLSGDISEGGIRLNVKDFIPLGSLMELKVNLANNQVVECLGKVVWVEKMSTMDRYQVGLTFTDLALGTKPKQCVKRYLDENLSN